MRTNVTPTELDQQAEEACKTLRDGIAAMYAIMNPTAESLFPQLVRSLRELTGHLTARTFTDAAQDDEDAVIAIERAEGLLYRAARVSGQPKSPLGIRSSLPPTA